MKSAFGFKALPAQLHVKIAGGDISKTGTVGLEDVAIQYSTKANPCHNLQRKIQRRARLNRSGYILAHFSSCRQEDDAGRAAQATNNGTNLGDPQAGLSCGAFDSFTNAFPRRHFSNSRLPSLQRIDHAYLTVTLPV